MMHNLDLLKPAAIFATVVHEGSFRRAAKLLNLSPSVVSQAVTALEAQLGAQLLYRSTRKLTLTHLGETYFQELAAALERIGVATQEVQGNRTNPAGRLRISAPTVIASSKFAGYLGLYRERAPDVEIEIDLSDELRDAIDDRFDLVLRISELDMPTKGAELMFRTSGLLCASPRYFQQLSGPQELEQLCWIRPPTLGPGLSTLSLRDRAEERITPSDSIVVNSGQLVRELLDKGTGFAVFPDFAISEALEKGELVNILPDWTAGERGLFAVHSASNAKLSIARGFVEGWRRYIAETCG